jgi:hypothetical protein
VAEACEVPLLPVPIAIVSLAVGIAADPDGAGAVRAAGRHRAPYSCCRSTLRRPRTATELVPGALAAVPSLLLAAIDGGSGCGGVVGRRAGAVSNAIFGGQRRAGERRCKDSECAAGEQCRIEL